MVVSPEYDCQFVLVTNDTIVFHDKRRRHHVRQVLGVQGQVPLQPEEHVADQQHDAREDDDRGAVALPRLLRLGVDAR
jgi:hypothetical protein